MLYKTKLIPIDSEHFSIFQILENKLSLTINEKEGFITISFTDTNKNIAAQITQISQNLLQEK